jgi:glutamine amidotransferase
MKKVGIIDYGGGNFTSVWNAVNFITKDVAQITMAEEIKMCSHIILPGVGTFASLMNKIEDMNIKDDLLYHILSQKIIYLGICVGMQILATTGKEFEDCDGLDLIKGSVIKLDVNKYPLPHIGWNEIIDCKEFPLFYSIDEDKPTFYFVHSYHFIPEDDKAISARSEYEIPFVAAISKDNIYGVQFHPEKSQYNGLKLLENFISL